MENGRDCVLIEIAPPIIGQLFGLGDNDIDKLILTSRWSDSGFPAVTIGAMPVLIYRILNLRVLSEFSLRDSDVELTAWGEIYPTLKAAEEASSKAE